MGLARLEENMAPPLTKRKGELEVIIDKPAFKELPKQDPEKTLYQDANGKVITPEKIEAMKKYARDLRRKHPTMKAARIQRKTEEFFKIKYAK